eukprot:1147514-Pelagomonas_calceolata.AAC.5
MSPQLACRASPLISFICLSPKRPYCQHDVVVWADAGLHACVISVVRYFPGRMAMLTVIDYCHNDPFFPTEFRTHLGSIASLAWKEKERKGLQSCPGLRGHPS